MTLSGFTLIFEAAFAVLLVVTIVYAVKLNQRLSGLRGRDVELREMISEFDRASSQARESAAALKSAGIDAERQVKAVIEQAQGLRDDLTFMIEDGERIADGLERSTDQRRATPESSAGSRTSPPSPASPEPGSDASGVDTHNEAGRYRSEIEQALAKVIRSTATAG